MARPEFHGIAETREKLREIIDAVSTRGEIRTLGRRNHGLALLLPMEPYRRLLAHDLRGKLSLVIATEVLRGAPPHLLMPAIRELEERPLEDLIALLPIPTDESSWEHLERTHPEPQLVQRLRSRQKLCLAIIEAEQSGIIDAAEHHASSTDL